MKQLQEAKIINVIVGREAHGGWYAMSPMIPWLVAEGETQEQVLREAERIALGLHGNEPVVLEWFWGGDDQ